MKRRLLIALLGLSAIVTASAQTAPLPVPVKMKKVTISGRVTDDGAAITADAKRMWSIANGEVLRAHVGEYVTVRGAMDSVTRRVEVRSFRPASTQVSTSARLGDSAFRR